MKSDIVRSRRPIVLVFDDSDICLDLAEVALDEAGFAVVTQSSGKEADVRFLESDADCVVLDLSMPDGDPRTMAAKIRAAATRPVPIILHSDRPTAELDAHVAACGAAFAVPKTADSDALVEAVRAALGWNDVAPASNTAESTR